MPAETDDTLLRQRLRVMQLIAAALILGVLFFLGIVLFQRGAEPPAGGVGIISLVAVLLLATNAPLAQVLPAILTRSALRRIASGTWQAPPGAAGGHDSDAAKLLTVQQTAMLIGLALLEGVAFLGCVAYLLEGEAVALAVVGVALFLMVLNFPTEGRLRAWLQAQEDRLAALRHEAEVSRH